MDTETKQNIPVKTDKASSGAALSTMNYLKDMERTLERFFNWRHPALSRWSDFPQLSSWFNELDTRLPSLDVVDRNNEILVRAEVPGIDKKDISITMTDDLLTIKGNSRAEKKEEKGDYHRREISSTSFARSVTLPGAVDVSKANATLKDGILEILLPKLESSKRRSISIQ